MNAELLYLRPNIQVEPLVDHWYAWSHLIPPVSAARNLTQRHVRIMDSYIADPEVHAEAVKNPKMAGGPFIDYCGKRADEIRALRDDTLRKRSHWLQLSRALEDLDSLLRAQAKGLTLQPLYERIPAILKGYIELVYDLNSNAGFRLVEPLLYRSPLYQADAQSLMLSEISRDDRPFALSTPRLESPHTYHLKVSFADELVDRLFRMKTNPEPLSKICDLLGDRNGGANGWMRFFTSDVPPRYPRYTGRGVRWRYFGHACVLVETNSVSVLVDPVLSYTYENHVSRYTYQDLPDHIDYVLITHNHQDHLLFETLLQIRHKVGQIVVPRSGGGSLQDPSLKLLLEKVGFQNVVELGEFETLGAADFVVVGLPFFGEHADLDIRSKLAYLIKTSHRTILFAADSCNIEPALYQHIACDVGSVDVLFIGMECDGAPLSWLYGPLFTRNVERAVDQTRRLSGSNYAQALALIEALRCKEVYVYAMGLEPWLKYFTSIVYTEQSRPIVDSDHLIGECLRRGIVSERLFGEKEIFVDA
jgi:L-ascorbate metabolism protein UlaG (beta-lactamase superfamily)